MYIHGDNVVWDDVNLYTGVKIMGREGWRFKF